MQITGVGDHKITRVGEGKKAGGERELFDLPTPGQLLWLAPGDGSNHLIVASNYLDRAIGSKYINSTNLIHLKVDKEFWY